MKTLITLVAALVLLGSLGISHAQSTGAQGPPMYSKDCAHSPQYGKAVVCFDTTLTSWFAWDPTSQAFISIGATLPPGTNSGDMLFYNGVGWVSSAVSGDLCENTFADFTLCAIQGIPIQGLLSTSIAGQVLATDGAGHIVPYLPYTPISMPFTTPTTNQVLSLTIPALNFNANFGSANGVPASSNSCITAPSGARDYAVKCIISGSLTQIGDITVSTSCAPSGDGSVTLTTVGGTAKSCSAGLFEMVAPATVDGTGNNFLLAAHQ